MSHNQLHWEHVLKRTGHRVTRQRTVILEALCARHGHASFDEVLAAVRRQDRTVDRSTVYRAQHLFVDLGLVVEAKVPGGETRYEIRTPRPHHHLVCQQCGEEREVSNDTIQSLIEEVFRAHGFRVAMDHLVLTGVCERCLRARAVGSPGSAV